jgi:type I restriction enzyme, S subunit
LITPLTRASAEHVRLGEVVSFKTGRLNSNAAVSNGAYPFFTCSQDTLRTTSYSFDTEAVLLAGNNANGIYPIKYFQGKFDVYQRTYVIRSVDNSRLCNRYLYYALQPKLDYLRSVSTGAATKFLTLGILKDLQLKLPPLETQRQIAGILSAYDDLIENNTRRIRILEEMAQSLYREWFVHFRYPGHEHVPLVESSAGPIPEGWEVVPFTSIADVLSGGTPKTTVPEYWDGDIPFFAPRDAPDGFYVTTTSKHITRDGLAKCNSKLYPKDTVFVTARGTVGKVVLAAVPMAMNQSCYALRGCEGINQNYLFMVTQASIDYLKQNTGGATFDTIVVDTFRRMQVVRPSYSLVCRFSDIVTPLLALALNLTNQIAVLRNTRDTLIPELISS